jgi:hypothetical protein
LLNKWQSDLSVLRRDRAHCSVINTPIQPDAGNFLEIEMETVIHTEDRVRVSIDSWDDGGVWLSLQLRGASANAVLTRAEALTMLAGLQAILAAEEVAV